MIPIKLNKLFSAKRAIQILQETLEELGYETSVDYDYIKLLESGKEKPIATSLCLY